jgi:maltose alpha-D-glucosyltransferase/alpha-amylase
MMRMRKKVPEISWSDFAIVPAGTEKVSAERYVWQENSAPVMHNLSPEPREVLVDPGVAGSHDSLLVNLLSEYHREPGQSGHHRDPMEAYSYRCFRVGGFDCLLRRGET